MSGLFDQVVNYSPPLLTAGQVNYDGTWDAATNTPTLVSPPDALSKGDYYVVSVAGTQFGLSFAVGDWIISNGTAWEKVDLTDAVSSVFGRTGAVVGVSTDYSAVGLTNTAIGAANPSTGAFTSLSSSSTTTLNGTTIPASKTLVVTTDKLSALAATTSAELAGVISDETGSGALVFANSPTLVTPALGAATATSIAASGTMTGSNLSGTNTGDQTITLTGGVTGSGTGSFAATVVTNANLTGAITSVGNATSLGSFTSANLAAAVTDETGSGALVFASSPTLVTPTLGAATATSLNGVTLTGTSTPALSVTGTASVSGSNTGDQTTITGNAGTATILQNARNINGVSFNGSADITVTAAAGTLTGATLASGVTASSLTSLGTITSLTATALTVNDNTTLGSSNSDTVVFNARVASDLNPSTDNTYDLGVTGHEWRDLNIDGTANIDSLVADTADINGGTIDGTAIGATTPSTVAATTGTFDAAGTADPAILVGAAGTGVNAGTITLRGGSGTGGGAFIRFTKNATAQGYIGNDSAVNGGTSNDLTLYTPNNVRVYASNTQVGTFTSTGLNSTAIGATTPATGAFTTLSATGQVNITGGTLSQLQSQAGSVYFEQVNTNTGAGAGVQIFQYNSGAGAGGDASIRQFTGAQNWIFGIDNSDGDKWKVSASDTLGTSDVLAVSSTGLAVTGALSSTSHLQVNGETFANSNSMLGASFTNAVAGASLRSSDDSSGVTFQAFRKANNTVIGSISRVTTTDAVAYNTTSDGRLKENLRDFTDSGRLIDALKPRVFDWKNSDENGKNVVGFIAQEEHAADPIFAHIGAVSVGDEDPETITKQWQRSDSALIPILVAELKSVRARLAALESK